MELTWDNSRDNLWYVNPACIAWRLTTVGAVEIATSLSEKGSWVHIGAPTNTAVPWSQLMKDYSIYPVKPADDAEDPHMDVWQVHTATVTIPSNGDYSIAIESDNYGYLKITDSSSNVLIDQEISYQSGMGTQIFPMTLAAGNYTIESRVKNIERTTEPAPFTYQEQFTSSDGGTAQILAGYGIPNKSAFCGTYEFPKKISYWKVEIDPKALIPRRTMDEAKLEAIVGDDGEIKSVHILNGGRGYVNPTIQVMDPQGLDDFSPNDSADFMADKLGMDPDAEKAIADPDKEDTSMSTMDMKTHSRVWKSSTESVDAEDKNKDVYRLKRAEVEISQLDDEGIIRAVRVVDPGAGYSQANNVLVHVVDPEQIQFEGVKDKDGNYAAGGAEVEQAAENMDKAWDHTFEKKDVVYGVRDEATMDDYSMQPLSASMDPMTRSIVKESMKNSAEVPANNATQVSVTVPDSYIRAAGDGIDDDVTKLCFNLPAECIEVSGSANMKAGMPDAEQFEYVAANESGVQEFQDGAMGYALAAVDQADTFGTNMSHLYGPFGQDKCIEMIQPKLYNITRWFDMPCAYLDTNEEGERKAFGSVSYTHLTLPTKA